MAQKPSSRTTAARRPAAPQPARSPRVLPVVGALVVVAALVVAVVALTLLRTGGGTTQAHGVVRVEPKAAYGLLQQYAGHSDFRVIDVRTPEEFASGHLPGATNIDVNGAAFDTQVKALDRASTYLVYCHSGNRSARATATMDDLGFTTVYDLRGGISAWAQAGYPVSS